jgi:hypothetical protein
VSIVSDLPVPLDQLERATTREVQGQMMFEGAAGNKYTVDPMYENIHEFIEKWEDSWPIAESYFPPDPTLVAQAISNGTAVMVSNGSYKALLSTEIGAAAWILECSQTGATCCGECSTSGLRNEVNAYRSELQGCHAGLLGLYAFSIYHQLQGGSVTFHFDNDAGVDKSAERHLNVPKRYKHADLVRVIRVIVFRLRTGREWRNRVANLGIWLLEMDTHPSIKTCIMESLSLRATTTLLSPSADHICMTAALEQDKIGWQNFVEGKISKSWGVLQWNHYQEQLSVRTGDKWSMGLVTQLLELTHGMWKHRNSILHAVDAQGLPLQQAAELEAAIHSEFRKGTEGLARKDQHFIRRGRDDIFSMSVIDKRGWLRGIQLARESQVTAPPAHQQQQQSMINFFQMTDD